MAANPQEEFANLIAPNKILNATIKEGLDLVSKIKAAGLAGNPRLYANQVGGMPADLIPLTEQQDNSDLPAWVRPASDNLTELKVPQDLPIYLQVWLNDFFNVSCVYKLVQSGVPVNQALF